MLVKTALSTCLYCIAMHQKLGISFELPGLMLIIFEAVTNAKALDAIKVKRTAKFFRSSH